MPVFRLGAMHLFVFPEIAKNPTSPTATPLITVAWRARDRLLIRFIRALCDKATFIVTTQVGRLKTVAPGEAWSIGIGGDKPR